MLIPVSLQFKLDLNLIKHNWTMSFNHNKIELCRSIANGWSRRSRTRTRRTHLLTRMTIVVMTAARKTKPPKAPRATMAPRLSLASLVSLRSGLSTAKGTLTLGDWFWRMLTLSAISLSCGCEFCMICCVLRVVVSSVGRVRGGVGAYVETGGGAYWVVLVDELELLPVLLVAGVLLGFLGMSTGRTVRRGGNSSRTVPGTGTLMTSSSESAVRWMKTISGISFK